LTNFGDHMVVWFTSIYAIGGTAVVMIDGGWIYNYLCNQCLSPLKLVKSNPAHGEVYLVHAILHLMYKKNLTW
jgi:hypothetical protein